MNLRPDGWLEPSKDITHVPTGHHSPLDGRILGIVWHWTGGPCLGQGYGPALAREIAQPGSRAVSWHFLVCKNGRVLQSVPTTRSAWHVGRPGFVGGSPVKMATGGYRVQTGTFLANVNAGTVGIELENAGLLTMELDGFRCEGYPDAKHAIPTERGVQLGGVWYDGFPDAQVCAARELTAALAQHLSLDRAACSAGHCMYDPTRKLDPGPLWLDRVLPTILDAVFPAPGATT